MTIWGTTLTTLLAPSRQVEPCALHRNTLWVNVDWLTTTRRPFHQTTHRLPLTGEPCFSTPSTLNVAIHRHILPCHPECYFVLPYLWGNSPSRGATLLPCSSLCCTFAQPASHAEVNLQQ
ncbi:hypothetical protein HDV57DRAFT_501615 [Trichoderma longibrachiatum]